MNRCRLCSRVVRLFTSGYMVSIASDIGWKARQSCWALGLISAFVYEIVGGAMRAGQRGTRNALLLQLVWLSALAIGRRRLLEDVQESVRRRTSGRAACSLSIS